MTSAMKRRRILYLLPFPPSTSPRDGGTRAMSALVSAMAMRHEVHVVWLAPEGHSASDAVPEGIAAGHEIPVPTRKTSQFSRRISLLLLRSPDWVRESRVPAMEVCLDSILRKHCFDVIQCEFHVMAQYLSHIRERAPSALRIVTEHEPGIRAQQGQPAAGLKARAAKMMRKAGWARYEKRVLADADGVIVFTDTDRHAIERLIDRNGPTVRTIPLRIPIAPDRRMESSISSDLMFFGNFDHPPNVDAAMRLIRSIFPIVRQQRPDTNLVLVGPNPTPEMLGAVGEGIRITGGVESVQPYLAGASIVLAPLYMGGGMRVKVIEACAAGCALITSPRAICGLDLVQGKHCEIADDDGKIAALAIDLLADDARRETLGKNAQKWADRFLDQQTWIEEYETFYDFLEDRRANA